MIGYSEFPLSPCHKRSRLPSKLEILSPSSWPSDTTHLPPSSIWLNPSSRHCPRNELIHARPSSMTCRPLPPPLPSRLLRPTLTLDVYTIHCLKVRLKPQPGVRSTPTPCSQPQPLEIAPFIALHAPGSGCSCAPPVHAHLGPPSRTPFRHGDAREVTGRVRVSSISCIQTPTPLSRLVLDSPCPRLALITRCHSFVPPTNDLPRHDRPGSRPAG